MRGLRVEHDLRGRDPQPGQFVEDVDDFVSLEVVDENVGQPEVLDELQVDGHVDICIIGHVDARPGLLPAELGLEVDARVEPLHVEVTRERDRVVLVVDAQHFVDVDGDFDVDDALDGQIVFRVFVGQTGQSGGALGARAAAEAADAFPGRTGRREQQRQERRRADQEDGGFGRRRMMVTTTTPPRR